MSEERAPSADRVAAAFQLASDAGLRFPFRGRGHSMWPLLRPGDTALFEPLAGAPRPGEIVLARGPEGLYAHRLVSRLPDGRVILRGDFLPADDPPIRPDDLLGRLVAVERAGRTLRADSPALEAYGRALLAVWRRAPALVPAARAAALLAGRFRRHLAQLIGPLHP